MAGRSVQSNVVIRINDREITNTYRGIGAEVSRLQREIRGMTVGSEEYIRTSQQLRTVRARFEEVRREINGTRQETESLFQIFAGNIAADFFENATSKAMEWGQQLAKRVEDLVRIKSALSTLDSDLKGADLNKATASVQAIVDTYEKSAEEIQSAIKGMNVLTDDTEKSLKLIVDGFDSGADASGEMLAQIKEYAPMMKDAKVSAEQMMAIIAQTEKMGVYDDKGIDVIKEGMLRVRKGTKATKDAMRALGIDIDATYKKISAGTISYFDVLQMVSAKIADVGADSRLTGTAIADIFGGPGEDAGYQYLSQLKDINTNLDTLVVSTNETAVAKKAEFEANEKLNNIWVNLTGTASLLSLGYSKVKSALADMLSIIFDLENEDPSEEYLRMAQKLRHLKETILAVIAVMASYRAGLILTTLLTRGAWQQTLIYNAVQKAKVIGETVARASTLLYAAAKALLTGNIVRATVAMRAFNMTTKLNPLGFLLSLLTAAVAAFVIFRNRVREAREEIAVLSREQRLSMEMQKSMNKQVLQDVQELKRKIDPLIKTLNDQNKTLQQRKDAYEQLVKIAPEFRGTVDKEYYATMKLSEAYGTLISRITNLAKKRALESLTSDKQSALIREETKMDMLASEREENIYKMTGVFPGKTWIKDPDFKQLSAVESNVLANRNKVLTLQIAASAKKAESLQKDIDDLNSTIEKRYANVFEDDKKNGGSKDFDFDKAAEDEKKRKQAEKDRLKAEKDHKKELEEIEKAEKESHERLLKLQEEYQNSKSEVIEDEFQKEAQKEVDRRNQEEANFEKQIVELQNRKEKSKSASEKVDIDKSIDLINKINEQKEEEHRQKMLAIQQKYDTKLIQDYIENQQKANNDKRILREQEINEITTYEDFKQKLSKDGFLKLSTAELNGVKNLEDAKKALRRKADQELLKAQLISLQKTKEMLTSQLEFVSGDLKKQMLQDLAKVSEEIAKIVGDLQGSSGDLKNPKEEIDILGFTAQQWDDVFNNLDDLSGVVAGIGSAFQALGNAATLYGDLQRALGERELKNFTKIQNAKKAELDRKLKLGLISQENYTKETELLDAQLANKQAEIEYKQAKAEKASKLFSAIGATALGVANALSIAPPLGIALAAIVGALGAVQIATIAAQPLPELQSYAKGGYFEGFTGDSNLPADETGERPYANVKLHRKEWVAPRWMTEHPVISKDINRLEFMRANKITSLAEGGFADSRNTTTSFATNPTSNDSTTVQYIAVMNDVKTLLRMIYDEGVQSFIVDDAKNWKRINRMNKDWETLVNKNKH